MAARIRLARYGATKKPFYRVVVTSSEFPRDGRFIEVLGTYDPRNKSRGINLKVDEIRKWVAKGAEMSDTVRKIVKYSSKQAPPEK
jgi:small subunit ribosomal protein S16